MRAPLTSPQPGPASTCQALPQLGETPAPTTVSVSQSPVLLPLGPQFSRSHLSQKVQMIFPKCTSEVLVPCVEPSLGCHCPENKTQPRPAREAGVARRTPMGPEPWPLLPAHRAAASQTAPASVLLCLGYSSPGPAGDRSLLATQVRHLLREALSARNHGAPPPVSIPADTTPITLLRSLLSARVLLSLSRLKATGGWGPCMFWSPPYTQRPARGLARSRCSKIIRRTD